MNALVLSGGGGKGAYQIGVWKALRKLHYKINIVTGTSVGCLNALLITQNSFLLAPYIWKNIDFTGVFQDDIKGNQNINDMIKMYGKNIIKNKGMSTDNLEKKLDKVVHYRKFYKSKIDFGLVTYNVSSFKPTLLTKKEIPKEKLKDYLMASATCFPAFKVKNIDGIKYIDGGYYDVMPINLAIDMGATNIIAVDLKSIGIRRKVKNKNIHITYIYPRNKIGYCLLFDKNINRRNMKYGYNDTMKTFHQLDGNQYTFKKNHLSKNYHNYIERFRKNISLFLGDKPQKKNKIILKSYIITHFLNDDYDSSKDFIKIMEKLAKYFKIPDEKIYSINHFHALLKKELFHNNNMDYLKISIKNLKLLSHKEDFIKYLYFNMCNHKINRIKRIAFIYPHEFICANYLYTILEGVHHAI